jgi:hypothetical protein
LPNMPSKSSQAAKRRRIAIDKLGPLVEMPIIGTKDEQELALESLLFGGDNLDELLGTGKTTEEQEVEQVEEVEEEDDDAPVETNFGFVIDTVGTTQTPSSPIEETIKGGDGAAWIDEETEKISVNIASSSSRLRKLREDESETSISGQEYESRLRKQFEKINPIPSWAAKAGEDEIEDDGLAFLKSSGTNRNEAQSPFASEHLDIQRMADANKAEYCHVYIIFLTHLAVCRYIPTISPNSPNPLNLWPR